MCQYCAKWDHKLNLYNHKVSSIEERKLQAEKDLKIYIQAIERNNNNYYKCFCDEIEKWRSTGINQIEEEIKKRSDNLKLYRNTLIDNITDNYIKNLQKEIDFLSKKCKLLKKTNQIRFCKTKENLTNIEAISLAGYAGLNVFSKEAACFDQEINFKVKYFKTSRIPDESLTAFVAENLGKINVLFSFTAEERNIP